MKNINQVIEQHDVQEENFSTADYEVYLQEARELNHIRRREAVICGRPRKQRSGRWEA